MEHCTARRCRRTKREQDWRSHWIHLVAVHVQKKSQGNSGKQGNGCPYHWPSTWQSSCNICIRCCADAATHAMLCGHAGAFNACRHRQPSCSDSYEHRHWLRLEKPFWRSMTCSADFVSFFQFIQLSSEIRFNCVNLDLA